MQIDLCSLVLDFVDFFNLDAPVGLDTMSKYRQPPVDKLFLDQLPPANGSVLVNWCLTTSANLNVAVRHELVVCEKGKGQLLRLGLGENGLLEVLERRCSVHDDIWNLHLCGGP